MLRLLKSPIVVIAIAAIIITLIVIVGKIAIDKIKLDSTTAQKKVEATLPPFPTDKTTSLTSCISDVAARNIGYTDANAAALNSCKSIGKDGSWGVYNWECTDNSGNVGKIYKCL
jgi:hypothetical protein